MAGGYHIVVAKKVDAKPVAPAPLNKYGWPVKTYAWPDGVVGEDKRAAWKCGSRRHAGECANLAGRILFTRIKQGLERLPKAELLLMVLTLKHREWPGVEAAYLGIHPLWRKLMKRLQRRWGDLVPVLDEEGRPVLGRPRIVGTRMVVDASGKPVVKKGGKARGFVKTEPVLERRPKMKRTRPRTLTVVEKHPRSGFPHLNVIMVCEQLALDLGHHEVMERQTPSGRVERIRVPTTPLGKRTLRELKAMANDCGFGWALSASPIDSVEAVAGYMVKTAKAGGVTTAPEGDIGSAPVVGEVAKLSQVADNAPLNFRAVRATPGLLPPVWTESEYVGEVKFYPKPADDNAKPVEPRPVGWVDHLLKRQRESERRVRASLAHALQLDLLWWAANQEPEQLELFAA